ncbi:MAG TPA: hypothetical protein VHN36_08305 [Ilumatobacteraceae bacterium]|nr:hypothetical protein [Ilumatobacteraceae bacterium]
MTEASEPFTATHTTPAAGMATWPHPGSATTGPRLDPHLLVQLVRVYGDWAQIVCSNGWSAWVDGRVLAPAGQQRAAASAPRRTAGASLGRYTFNTPTKATWPLSAGAVLVVVAVFLPWIDFGGGADTVNALDVPLMFLLGKDNLLDGGPGLGIVLLLLAVGAFMLGHISGLENSAKVPGALCVPAVVMFLVQTNALLSAAKNAGGTNVPSLLDVVGFGVWLALVGAASLAWGGKRT